MKVSVKLPAYVIVQNDVVKYVSKEEFEQYIQGKEICDLALGD